VVRPRRRLSVQPFDKIRGYWCSRKLAAWVAAQDIREYLEFTFTLCILLADHVDFEVEQRGFEPLTSAVQSHDTTIVDVRRCSQIPAKRHGYSENASLLFTVVRVGWCITGVNKQSSPAAGEAALIFPKSFGYDTRAGF
jgi:hypothetical protein